MLTGASAAAAGAAYATIAAEGQDDAERDAPSDPRELSYRETDHIRQFYARTRF